MMSVGLSHRKALTTEGYGLTLADLPPLESGRLDPRSWFAEPSHPLEMEIGCGKGTFLAQQAKLRPNVNYLGIEWAREFFRFAADRMRRHQLMNVRILHADATEFIRHRCVDAVASVIHLYFSDPWPKKRHHKRRVIQDRTLLDFHRILQDGGEIRLVTDHQELFAWYEERAVNQTTLFERVPFAAPKSAVEGEIVGSNFERKYRQEGRPFHAMTLRKL